jgi:hypothetical protein
MIYEGTNKCFGSKGGDPPRKDAYFTTAIATSRDWGHSWPTYRGTPEFKFVPLPEENTKQGPEARFGALGGSVCEGNDCGTAPPFNYGRYPVLGPKTSIAHAMASGKTLGGDMGETEPSAFHDDVTSNAAQYLYVVHSYLPGILDKPPLLNGRRSDLMIARAPLNGGSLAVVNFLKWDGSGYVNPGLGGDDAPIFPSGPYANCGDETQSRQMGSISYVEGTKQYLLTFVCASPTDPSLGGPPSIRDPDITGAAWFYSTSYHLDNPVWSAPKEIIGSWSTFGPGAFNYKGNYPTFMSLDSKPGHLLTNGYVFYLWGSPTGNTPPPGRQYSSRYFTIKIQ